MRNRCLGLYLAALAAVGALGEDILIKVRQKRRLARRLRQQSTCVPYSPPPPNLSTAHCYHTLAVFFFMCQGGTVTNADSQTVADVLISGEQIVQVAAGIKVPRRCHPRLNRRCCPAAATPTSQACLPEPPSNPRPCLPACPLTSGSQGCEGDRCLWEVCDAWGDRPPHPPRHALHGPGQLRHL